MIHEKLIEQARNLMFSVGLGTTYPHYETESVIADLIAALESSRVDALRKAIDKIYFYNRNTVTSVSTEDWRVGLECAVNLIFALIEEESDNAN